MHRLHSAQSQELSAPHWLCMSVAIHQSPIMCQKLDQFLCNW